MSRFQENGDGLHRPSSGFGIGKAFGLLAFVVGFIASAITIYAWAVPPPDPVLELHDPELTGGLREIWEGKR